MSRKAIFMDRDGTVCEEVGYVNHPTRCRLLPRSAEAVRRVNASGFAAVIVTNQAGVARGYFEESVIHATHERLAGLLAESNARLDGIYACVHHPDVGEPPYRQACGCRKPLPGLLRRAADELDLDLTGSYMIGDSVKDMEAGRGAGATSVLVLTGYGLGEWEYRPGRFDPKPAHVAGDLLDAVAWILDRERS